MIFEPVPLFCTDAASGPCFLNELIPVISVDKNEDYIKSGSGEKYVGDVNNLQFENETFDWVFCIDSVHLLTNTKELIRVLKKKGVQAAINYPTPLHKQPIFQKIVVLIKSTTIPVIKYP